MWASRRLVWKKSYLREQSLLLTVVILNSIYSQDLLILGKTSNEIHYVVDPIDIGDRSSLLLWIQKPFDDEQPNVLLRGARGPQV